MDNNQQTINTDLTNSYSSQQNGYSNDSMNTTHHDKKRSISLVISAVLLILFLSITTGVLVLVNNQNSQVADTRSEAAEFGNLMSLDASNQSCQDISIYKGDEKVSTSSLRPGDTVTLAVAANNATQARFRVNQEDYVVTTTKNSANEFTTAYTFPETMTSVVIRAERFMNNAWQ